jgi:hypothetical protein
MYCKVKLGLVVVLALAFCGSGLAQMGPYWHGGHYGDTVYDVERHNARDFGFRDGRDDGERDRVTGHSYRPTHDSNYKHADRGYDSAYGNWQLYRDEYRAAYAEGYERGFHRP